MVCVHHMLCPMDVQALITWANSEGSCPQLVREGFQEAGFTGEPQKQGWVSGENPIDSLCRVQRGHRRVVKVERWVGQLGLLADQTVWETNWDRSETREQRLWTQRAGTRMGRVGSRTGTLPGWRARQMLLADNLMFGCYGIARQVERMGRRLPTWELTNGMSSFPIWVTVSNLSLLSD